MLKSLFGKGKSAKIRFDVEFLPFIISSLGELLNKSIINLTRIIEISTKREDDYGQKD
jgi:hypothetical protein